MSPLSIVSIDGMHAVHAVRAVEMALGALPGVTSTSVSLGEAAVAHDGALAPDLIETAVRDAGFTVTAVREDRRHRLPMLD
jgi:copper chaperone CopZ